MNRNEHATSIRSNCRGLSLSRKKTKMCADMASISLTFEHSNRIYTSPTRARCITATLNRSALVITRTLQFAMSQVPVVISDYGRFQLHSNDVTGDSSSSNSDFYSERCHFESLPRHRLFSPRFSVAFSSLKANTEIVP